MGIGGSFSGGHIGRSVNVTTNLYLMPRSRIMELYLHFPIDLHGIMLN
jgi:hypothetical protein